MPQEHKYEFDAEDVKIPRRVHAKDGLNFSPTFGAAFDNSERDAAAAFGSEVRDAAAALEAIEALLQASIGKVPAVDELPGVGTNTGTSILDRIKAADPAAPTDSTLASGFEDPLPRQKPHRSTLVGPSAPSNAGIASQSSGTRRFIVQDRSYPNPIRMYVQESGGDSAYAEYDATTGELIGWGSETQLPDGGTRTERSHVEETPDGERVVVVEKTVTGPDGETTTSTDKHPYGQRDAPLRDPNFGGSMTGEEGAGGGLPLGIQYNPITGQYSGGKNLGNDQVNPGQPEASQKLTGPRLALDPKDVVVNPDPTSISGTGGLQRIEPIGPGARPPEEDLPPRPS